jgi:dipeptidyl-peptidase-3
MSLYDRVQGNWSSLSDLCGIKEDEAEAFLEYGAMFLANIGNYRVSTESIG